MVRYFLPLVLVHLLASVSPSWAAGPPPGARDGWSWTLQAAGVSQLDTDMDKGGEVGVDRYFVSLSLARQLSSRLRVGAELGYGEARYDFSGVGFGGADPWGTVRELRLSLPLRYAATDRWSLFAIPSIRFNAEKGADLDDGANGGLLAGAIYRVSDELSIGPGFGVFSEIEDDPSVFPVLLIDWRLSDSLSLKTGGGFAASRGPGLELEWEASEQWKFSVGGRYEKDRSRLDDAGVAPGGVAEDVGFPLYVSAEYSLSDNLQLGLIGGAKVGGELRLEDATGRLVSETDFDTAPFFGAMIKGRF